MSFSFDVKEEIISAKLNSEKARACLYGMLTFSNEFTLDKIMLQTENLIVAEHFTYLIGRATGNKNAVSADVTMKKNNVSLYQLNVVERADREAIFLHFGFENEKPELIKRDIFGENNLGAFVGGAFLVCGSINDPNKEYHLEFVLQTLDLCNDFGLILYDFGILAKHTERKSSQIIYLKESENVEDLLTLMGASKASLQLMEIKIVKDIRNKANRVANCDNANIEKTLKASQRQIDCIKIIEEKMGLDNLPIELSETAKLRLEYPEWNLKEIGENLFPIVSRSGVNHRFKKLEKIASEL